MFWLQWLIHCKGFHDRKQISIEGRHMTSPTLALVVLLN
jgi:hypothetical protein